MLREFQYFRGLVRMHPAHSISYLTGREKGRGACIVLQSIGNGMAHCPSNVDT